MLRGGYGKPWRPPPDGWSVPRKTFLGGLYQHMRAALNNLPRFTNNTQVTLQTNQVGPPVTRINPAALVANCGVTDTSGNPRIPWIGLADNQSLPYVLGGNLGNTFYQNGTNSFGQAARLRGFKNVQAVRQWHGSLPWTSHDGGTFADGICNTGSGCTASQTTYESPQLTAAQIKYLRLDWVINMSGTNDYLATGSTIGYFTVATTGAGSRQVDPSSGKITSNLSTSEVDTDSISGVTSNVVNGYDSISGTRGHGTIMALDLHTEMPSVPVLTIPDQIASFNNQQCAAGYTTLLPPISDPNNYNQTLNFTQHPIGDTINVQNFAIHIQWSRTATVFSWTWNFFMHWTTTDSSTPIPDYSNQQYSGSATLSVPNTAAAVYADTKNLLGYWNLADDAQYPPRTDGLWQIAPLVSREEFEGDQTPVGFNPYYVNDLHSPTIDSNGNSPWSTPITPTPLGWQYSPSNNDGAGRPPSDPAYSGAVPWNPTYNVMAWYDPNAYGFTFPAGRDQNSAPASGFKQFALTGLILGLPMPQALTDPNSYWYQPGAGAPAGADYENFFDFHAQVWRACEYGTVDGTFVDFYRYGYGQWLYDAIEQTGAQLPHCATQWTNLIQAFNKPPYAYLIQADTQTYDLDGQPSVSTDFFAYNAVALWAQKCCEIVELWPSQNFGRPAGNDRFAADENAVYCIDHWVGDTAYFLSDPVKINAGDFVGVSNNGNIGIYPAAVVDHAGLSIQLGAQLYPLPTGFALPSNDTGAAMWKVRFPSAPAILGRDAIATLTASGGNTIITLSNPEVNLMTGDTIDICSTTITYDAKGNRVSEAMTVLQSNIAVNRTDDTHFTVGVAIGTLTGAAYIVSHGAANWYWDDNGRRGDFVALQWLYDYRTNGEATRLAGVRDCTEQANYDAWLAGGAIGTPPSNSNPPPPGTPATNNGFQNLTALPAVCSANNSLAWTGDGFQAQGATTFKPCCYGVVAITPNGETWNNGVVIPFPANFNFDDRYGARWQAEIEQAMQDLLWQAPHPPCGLGGGINWVMDDGTCHANDDTDIYYAHAPFVEARINLPGNGGNAQNETAPALPASITIGYINPATTSGGLQPPGMIGYDPTSGLPSAAFTFWGYRLAIENNACFGSCQFNYVDAENLPCVISYTPGIPVPVVDPGTASGNSGDQTIT